MGPRDRESFAVLLGGLAEIFGESVSEVRAEGYFAALEDLSLASVRGAVETAVRTARTFPKPADLREFAGGGPAELAWQRVLIAIEQVGTEASVDFGDPVLHATVEAMGGWADAWRWERDDDREQRFRAAEFARLYRALAARGAALAAPSVLIGQQARQNALTRGSWTRGTEHVDAVLAIGPGGEARGPAALPPVASRRALSAGDSA